MNKVLFVFYIVSAMLIAVQCKPSSEDHTKTKGDVCKGLTSDDSLHEAWTSFKTLYNRQYSSGKDDEDRRQIFEKNARKIIAHNEQYRDGLVTYKMACNQFTDLRSDEKKHLFGFSGASKKLVQQ